MIYKKSFVVNIAKSEQKISQTCKMKMKYLAETWIHKTKHAKADIKV